MVVCPHHGPSRTPRGHGVDGGTVRFHPGVMCGVVVSPRRGPSRTPRGRGVGGCSWTRTQAVLGASFSSWVSASAGWGSPLPLSPRGVGGRAGKSRGSWALMAFSSWDFVQGVQVVLGTPGLRVGSHIGFAAPACTEQFNTHTQTTPPLQSSLGRGAQGTGRLHPGGSIPPRCFPTVKAPGAQGCLPLPSPPA